MSKRIFCLGLVGPLPVLRTCGRVPAAAWSVRSRTVPRFPPPGAADLRALILQQSFGVWGLEDVCGSYEKEIKVNRIVAVVALNCAHFSGGCGCDYGCWSGICGDGVSPEIWIEFSFSVPVTWSETDVCDALWTEIYKKYFI
ncbi:hypothetical protein CB1_000804009 [Camelus ferus]|nr:hypothetical protein CB1_000804009 [Camelus ferus]